MSLMPLITRAYYSIHDMKTPVIISIIALAVNVIIDISLAPVMGARGIALGTSASIILAAVIGLYDLNQRLGFMYEKSIKPNLVKYLVAAVVMISGIILTYGTAATSLENILLNNIITVGFSSIVGCGLYVLVLKVLE